MNGMLFESQEEKQQLAEMDEDDMVPILVQKMPMSVRKTFEHFALQMQLVVSTTTRARHALEEGSKEELTGVMDDGDAGITQQILKQCVVEASTQIGEVKELQNSWHKDTDSRVLRLARCADDAEAAKRQLAAVMGQLNSFGAEQAAKAKKVLVGMSATSEKGLLTTVVGTWTGWYHRYKQEQHIHDKFKKLISDAEDKLFAYKEKQLKNTKGVLMRNIASGDNALLQMIIQVWFKTMREERGDSETQQKMKEAQARLASYKKSQQENTKKVMARMSAGNDSTLLSLCWQSWIKFSADYKVNKEMEEAVRASERQLKEFMERKSEEAKGVLNRMSGSSDTGLMSMVFKAWLEGHLEDKRAKELEDLVNGSEAKMKSLNNRQKGAAKGVASRANKIEELNFMHSTMLAWLSEAKFERVWRHYSGKMDAKKSQLDAVQSMFKSFASQLEQGISSTPRSQRKSKGSRAIEGDDGRPPQMQ